MTLIDARPPALDVWYRPGNTFTADLTWPSGELDGRSFTAALDDDDLAVVVAGDVLTVTATAAQTTAGAAGGSFELVETTGGSDQTVMVGAWNPSTAPAASSAVDVSVTTSGASVDVTVAAALASPEVTHVWDRDGWDPFTASTMTEDGDQSFDQTVVNGRGVLTGVEDLIEGPPAVGGSLRVAYLREGTLWTDSEITSVVWSPTGWDGTNAQQGHLHRIREISPGTYEAIMIWTSVVFGGNYRTLHCTAVRWDGTSLPQGGGDAASAADSDYIDRQVRVVGRQRVLSTVAILTFTPPGYLRHLEAGDLVDLADITGGISDETDVAVDDVDDRGRLQCTTVESGDVTFGAVNSGSITPASDQKRWTPQAMSTRVEGGDEDSLTVAIKRWRPEEPEPDWSDARVRHASVATDVDVPELPVGPGLCGLFGGHFYDQSTGSWGDVRFRRL